MASSLMTSPQHSNKLQQRGLMFVDASGTNCLPSVFAIETAIEQSWQEGFDHDGALDNGWSLVGRQVSLWPSQVASVLRFAGLQSE